MKAISGKAWIFGDGIDTDIIIPARYLVLPMNEMKLKAMEPVDETFASRVAEGDIIVAGRNFGCGSSREQAPVVLRDLGVAAVVAESFARIFFRNAINVGLPVIECEGIRAKVSQSDTLTVELETGTVVDVTTRTQFHGSRLPEFLLEIISDGGLIPHLARENGRHNT